MNAIVTINEAPLWPLACPDWEERIRTGRSLVPDLPLNRARADRAVAIFDRLRLPDVPGNPTLREACGEWFRDIVRAVFGSWFPEEQQRYIREIFALVPKKNSKTSYGAALMLVALLMNERPSAAFHLFAPTQDITDLAFDQASGMVRLDSGLLERIRVQDHIKTLTQKSTGASLEVMSFDPKVVTGQKSSGWLLDELHVMAKIAKAASALRQLRGGMLPQAEAFGVIITTQSEEKPAGVFLGELRKARAIRDGKASMRTLPILYEFPARIAKNREVWRDPANWPMVLPNLGRPMTVGRLLELMDEEELKGEDALKTWASQHLNLEIGQSLGTDAWPGADFWERRAIKSLTLQSLLARCEVATIGIDGGGLDDLFGLCVLGREKVTKRWLAWTHAWAHRIVLLRRKAMAPKLLDLEAAGDLTLFGSEEEAEALFDVAEDDEAEAEQGPPEAPQDIAGIIDIVRQVEESGLLAMVGLDPAGVGAVVDALAEIGIGGEEDASGKERVVGVTQGWKLMSAIKTVERKLRDNTFGHAGQPMMTWCVGAAKVEPKGNAILITKQASSAGKIDPLMALFDAAALMSMNPEAQAGSIWDREDLAAALA